METPKDKAGDLTEKIMAYFWANPKRKVELSTEQYNDVYSHVLSVLQGSGEGGA